MRNIIINLAKSENLPDHVGLAYDVWAPIETGAGKHLGKVPPGKDPADAGPATRDGWLSRVAAITVNPDYEYAYQRWESSFEVEETAGTTVCFKIKLATRLLLGHGNPSPSDVGLTVHHTWGVPMISGSALKGLLNHYIQIVYGPTDTSKHPLDPEHAEMERAPFQGVVWKGRNTIAHGPGTIHRLFFGAPAARDDDECQSADFDSVYEDVGMMQGAITFHDALYVPNNKNHPPFAQDVLTPHQSTYYRKAHKNSAAVPNDFDDPIPVGFLSIRPETEFLIALSIRPDVSQATDWLNLAVEMLLDALNEWGIGGKTAQGYGRIDLKWTKAKEAERKEYLQKRAKEEAQQKKLEVLSPGERLVEKIMSSESDDPGSQGWKAVFRVLIENKNIKGIEQEEMELDENEQRLAAEKLKEIMIAQDVWVETDPQQAQDATSKKKPKVNKERLQNFDKTKKVKEILK